MWEKKSHSFEYAFFCTDLIVGNISMFHILKEKKKINKNPQGQKTFPNWIQIETNNTFILSE